MVGAEPTQLALAVCDLALELVDQPQAGLDRALPRLRQSEAAEQPSAFDAEQVGDGARLAMGEQDRVHALLQARAVADKMQTPARPFPLGTHTGIREPDRGHQIAAGELGQHPGIDAVGLAGQRRQPLHLLRVGDLDLPAGKLEPIVHEARSVHRLDRRADRRVVTIEPLAQTTQTIRVGRRGTNLDRHTLTVKQMKVETLATEIQTGVQHCNGPPFVSRGRAEHDSAGGPSSWHSLPLEVSGR